MSSGNNWYEEKWNIGGGPRAPKTTDSAWESLVVGEGISDKEKFRQRPEKSQRGSHVNYIGKLPDQAKRMASTEAFKKRK